MPEMDFNSVCMQYSKFSFENSAFSLNVLFGFMTIPANGMYAGLHRYVTQFARITCALERIFKYAFAQQNAKIMTTVQPKSDA